MPTSIFVDLRYRSDNYGNAYSAALIWIDGRPRHMTSLHYGGHHGYQEAATWLEAQGFVNLHGFLSGVVVLGIRKAGSGGCGNPSIRQINLPGFRSLAGYA